MLPKIVIVSFIMSVLALSVSYASLKREQIKRWWYKNISIHKTVKLVMHYDTTRTKVFYRLIPEDKVFNIDGSMYHYDKDATIKHEDLFAIRDTKDKKNNEKIYFQVEGQKYNFDLRSFEKMSQMFGNDNIVEIHYWHNIPTPINFDVKKKDLILSAKQMNDMKVNDLFAKLLRLEDQNMMMMIILICVIVVILIVGFSAYMDYDTNKILKDYIKMVSAPATKHLLFFIPVMFANRKKR